MTLLFSKCNKAKNETLYVLPCSLNVGFPIKYNFRTDISDVTSHIVPLILYLYYT